ncbi:LysR substrate-binding domain-containing protein [Sneathiella limimaris]|uniref:LysR substrate-binding domain-containing protein n=1 Tax=Sneathiella limimaris TaxID=1964213 RepID=UPI00146C3B58|nr:LysR substrate-binding domain-containing protein [Sneathiella limimaris]
MRLTHLNALRALEATLRHGSFTAAADELGITPAAVGQRVRALENYLGKALFDRSGINILPADEARRVEATLTNGFTTIASALEQLKLDGANKRIALTLPASFAENWFTPLISDFYQQHEEVDLRLDASNRDVDLLTGEFDFAIRYGRPAEGPIQEIDLFGDFILPVCSPEFATTHRLTTKTRSLKDVPLIHLLGRTGDPDWLSFEDWGKKYEFDPSYLTQGVSYSRISSGLRSAITGQGLVLCGLTEAYNEIVAGRLVMPFGSQLRHQTSYRYRLLWVEGKEMTSLQNHFIDWLLEKVSDFRRNLKNLIEANSE